MNSNWQQIIIRMIIYIHIWLYNILIISFFFLTDPRAERFPLMEHPLFTFGLVAIYLSWVLVLGPLFMRDRKPFQLRRTLVIYNAFQVLLSGYMFYEVSSRLRPHTEATPIHKYFITIIHICALHFAAPDGWLAELL